MSSLSLVLPALFAASRVFELERCRLLERLFELLLHSLRVPSELTAWISSYSAERSDSMSITAKRVRFFVKLRHMMLTFLSSQLCFLFAFGLSEKTVVSSSWVNPLAKLPMRFCEPIYDTLADSKFMVDSSEESAYPDWTLATFLSRMLRSLTRLATPWSPSRFMLITWTLGLVSMLWQRESLPLILSSLSEDIVEPIFGLERGAVISISGSSR